MRRLALIVAGVLLAALLIALPAIGSNGASGTYLVRGYFDNGSFVVSAEQVRIAGATVGTVQSVDVSNDHEIASLEGGPHAVPGKAVVVMAGPCSIEDEEHIIETAYAVKAAGANILRGGAFKPRSSPYAFRGLKLHGNPVQRQR